MEFNLTALRERTHSDTSPGTYLLLAFLGVVVIGCTCASCILGGRNPDHDKVVTLSGGAPASPSPYTPASAPATAPPGATPEPARAGCTRREGNVVELVLDDSDSTAL